MSIQSELETALLTALKATPGLSTIKVFEDDIRDCLFTAEKLTEGFRDTEMPALNLSASLDPTTSSQFTMTETQHDVPVSIAIVTKGLNRKAAWEEAKKYQEAIECILEGFRKIGTSLGFNAVIMGDITSSLISIKADTYGLRGGHDGLQNHENHAVKGENGNMSIQSFTGAWRALSCLTQVAIGTAQPVTDLLTFAGAELMEPDPETFYENTDEITGNLVPTKHQLLNMKFAGKHKAKATPTSVALFASMAMGLDTQTLIGATTAYSHLIQINKSIVEVPYRTLVENDGTSQFGYTGVGCTGFTISGQRGQFVEFEADLIGRASEAVDATAQPTANAESYLAYGNCDFLQGGAYDGTVVTGAASIAAQLVNFKLSYKNGAKGVYNVGDATGNVGSIRRGLMATIELDAEIELVDRTQRAALLAGTEYVMHIPIVGGVADGTAHYGIDSVLPRVAYKAAKKAAKDGVLSVAGKYAVLADATHGAIDIRVTNLYTHSYTATA